MGSSGRSGREDSLSDEQLAQIDQDYTRLLRRFNRTNDAQVGLLGRQGSLASSIFREERSMQRDNHRLNMELGRSRLSQQQRQFADSLSQQNQQFNLLRGQIDQRDLVTRNQYDRQLRRANEASRRRGINLASRSSLMESANTRLDQNRQNRQQRLAAQINRGRLIQDHQQRQLVTSLLRR